MDDWPVDVTFNLDGALDDADVVYLLRIQQERMDQSLLPSLREYSHSYGLDTKRAARLKPGALILHPGPMNRGVEIAADVADAPNAVITEQVANGVAVRMAVLFLMLGSGDLNA
jgi:aspartate carbamoyltransferase catalytic subunit